MSDHERDNPAEPEQPEQPDDMREADVANGEDPDVADEHPTGSDAARRNRENDPPA